MTSEYFTRWRMARAILIALLVLPGGLLLAVLVVIAAGILLMGTAIGFLLWGLVYLGWDWARSFFSAKSPNGSMAQSPNPPPGGGA